MKRLILIITLILRTIMNRPQEILDKTWPLLDEAQMWNNMAYDLYKSKRQKRLNKKELEGVLVALKYFHSLQDLIMLEVDRIEAAYYSKQK